MRHNIQFMIVIVLVFFVIASCIPVTINPSDPLENKGPYSIGKVSAPFATSTSSGGSLEAMFYYPVGTFENSSLPLVILSHGFGSRFQDYEIYANHLVSHGFIVYGINLLDTSSDPNIARHDHKAIQMTEAITYALDNSFIKALINPSKIAVMGHSMGGKISFMAAAQDSRINSVIGLDPSNAGGPPCGISPDNCANYPAAPNPSRGHIGVLNSMTASSLIFRSYWDASNPDSEFNASYFFYGDDGAGHNGVPAIAYYINMGSAPHASYLPGFNTPTPAIVKRSTLAWLQERFMGIDNSKYFSGSVMLSDISAGRVLGFSQR